MNLPPTANQIPAYLIDLFRTAINVAMPASCLLPTLPTAPKGRTLVIAVGKAAGSMAKVVDEHWPPEAPLSGIAITRYGHGVPCRRIEMIEASHPVPDNRGHVATLKILEEVRALGADDLLLFLVSGGGSALMTAPAGKISLDEKKSINNSLLLSGAPIKEMNIVRKHLSAVKGGQLAGLAFPAQIVTLAISDVPGDDPSTIASGPTVPDPSTQEDALRLIQEHNIDFSDQIRAHLENSQYETLKADDQAFVNAQFSIVAKPGDALAHIENTVKTCGLEVLNLGPDIEGEARMVALDHAKLVEQCQSLPKLIISGGETTVTVAEGLTGGKGGRNCEYLLALAIALNGRPNTYAMAADTDGIDGSETNAGAFITPDTLHRARSLGLDAEAYLASHDSFSFFEALGDLITTGPTRTNINDFRAIWVS